MIRRSRFWAGAVYVVLAAGLLVALSDAGLPLPLSIVASALVICLVAILAIAVIGFRRSREEGRGFWRSFGAGLRISVRAFFALF